MTQIVLKRVCPKCKAEISGSEQRCLNPFCDWKSSDIQHRRLGNVSMVFLDGLEGPRCPECHFQTIVFLDMTKWACADRDCRYS